MSFPELKHFTRDEAWGEPDRMSHELLFKLDAFRDWLGVRFLVTCGTQGVHVKDSQHYLGNAVDGIVELKGRPVMDVIMMALRSGFGGVGVYPQWTAPQVSREWVGSLGLHLDVRKTERIATWVGVDVGGKRRYLPLEKSTLSALSIY